MKIHTTLMQISLQFSICCFDDKQGDVSTLSNGAKIRDDLLGRMSLSI